VNPRRLSTALLLLVSLLIPATARAQVNFEFFLGTAFNVPTPLTIEQTGYPPISFTAHYDVRPFDDRMYYALRLEWWKQSRGWIVEELHHKLYLSNPQDGVQDFGVTHGYNIITLDRGWRHGQNTLMAGGGIVLGHPYSTVRGQQLSTTESSYHLGGVAVQAAAARRFDFSQKLFATVEGKITASWASMPVVNGSASVPNVAFHALAGLGIQF